MDDIEAGVVTALNHDGDGIVKSGKTAFVPGVLPGETVRFRRTRRHRQHDEAQLVEVLVPAADRVEPQCPHFGTCGGCALQHLAPAAQLAAKAAELADSLARIGRVEPRTWLAPLEGPVWNYRRRARLSARYVHKKGRSLVGFRERSAPYVAEIDSCRVLAPPFDQLVSPLSALLTGLTIRERVPQVEIASGERANAVILRVLSTPSADDLAAMRAFGAAHDVTIYLQSGGLDTVAPLDGVPAQLDYELPDFGLRLAFEPVDFVQVNAAINRALVSRAVEWLDPGPADRVLDLFCGLGNFTLALARRAGEVVGVEGDAGLIGRARANAVGNGIDNATFHVANLAAEDVDQSRWWAGGFTQVLLDPPRAGAREVLPAVARLAPRRIVYVSCHPGTLARDLGELVHEHGYLLQAAGVLDMFPHTTHVESMAVLARA
ncbi:MAG TPA: 23S rRNA (uracil(1939)-C(5))-methyltransferase RlmD [Steroidobacteraceae bacterium]|nr:23S rRNA (uracil(1939)-C(5))-methyltransferase RlmD [Steroidobacteraceae bacterium]HNS27523.1 23S rRNA (uracil(1939)-C(5))-methyltransferase RlmD [Steroidobacteraceae bacterium]